MRAKLQELWILVTADKKKVAMLGGLALALAVIVLKQGGLAGPRDALATAESQTALDRMPVVTADGLGLDGPVVTVERAEAIERDLFRLGERFFPNPTQDAQSDPDSPKSVLPVVETTDEPADRPPDDLPERVREEAARLRLKGTMVGSTPLAVIEQPAPAGPAEVVRLGGVVAGFTVVEIRAGGVVLERGGVRVELHRALPER